MLEIQCRNYSFEQSNDFHTEFYEAFDSNDLKMFELLEASFEGNEEFVGIDLQDDFMDGLRNCCEGSFDILKIICSDHWLCLREESKLLHEAQDKEIKPLKLRTYAPERCSSMSLFGENKRQK